MDKRKMAYFTAGVGILILVVVLLLAHSSPRQSGGITLPQPQADMGGAEAVNSPGEGLNVVRITPDTVQLAINTLSRPTVYSRTQVVETFWSGGSGSATYLVAVSGGCTRIDTQLADGSVRHTLASGNAAAVWYDEEERWVELRSQQFTADAAQRMPTYESVLALPVQDIAQADYRELDGVRCIYVETAPGENGCTDRYWVSVANGLLAAAERSRDGELLYRFTAGDLAPDPPEESLFLLPDGTPWGG